MSGNWDNWGGGGSDWSNSWSNNDNGGGEGSWGGDWKKQSWGDWNDKTNSTGESGGDVKRKKGGGGRMYPKILKDEHSEQLEMWRQMSKSIDDATEETINGVLEASHGAISHGFESTDGRLFNNGEISRIIEKVLEWSSPVHLRGFFFQLRGKLGWLMQQKTGSRVIEKLFKQCHNALQRSDNISKSTDVEDETQLPTITALLVGAAEELIQGDPDRHITLLDVVQDPSSSFALRVLIYVLGGQKPPEKRNVQQPPPSGPRVGGGKPLRSLGKAITKAVAEQSIFANRCRASAVTGLLEVLALVWEDGKPLHEQVFLCLESLLKDKTSSRVVEAVLRVPGGHRTLHPYFIDNWEKAASSSIHAVAKWVSNCTTKEDMSAVLDVLCSDSSCAMIKNSSHLAIVNGIVVGCQKFPALRKRALGLVYSVFGEDDLLKTLLSARSSKAGYLILSNLLVYGPKPLIGLFKSFPELPQWQLKELATGEHSFILDNFISGGMERDVKKLCAALKGIYLDIVLSGFAGAIVIEKLFDASPVSSRRTIAEELSAGMSQLQAVFHARKTIKKLRLDQFAHHNADWEDTEKRLVKKNKLLKTILSEPEDSKVKKAKVEKTENEPKIPEETKTPKKEKKQKKNKKSKKE